MKCILCKSKQIVEVVNLGRQPLCKKLKIQRIKE